MNINLVILAAGLGTRMKSRRAKVLHRAGGCTLIEHVIRTARALAEPSRITVVDGCQAEEVESLLGPQGVRFVRQTQQRGTGHALACCRESLQGQEGPVVVIYGDGPLLSSSTLTKLIEMHNASNAAATLIAARLDDPTGYGRVIAGVDGSVQAVVEEKAASPEQKKIREANMGIYAFEPELLWTHIGKLTTNNPAGEYYLTDMIEILVRAGHRVQSFLAPDPSELLGINTRVELAEADRILRERKARELMLAGVTIERPETSAIDVHVQCGVDTVIEPHARLLGRTVIGGNCQIGTGAILENAIIGDGVTIAPYTLVADSTIDPGAKVGPFARLRMNARVEHGAQVGNFVEMKKAQLGPGAKSMHLAYLGDAEIGGGSNIGAGTITCNYDGRAKHRTKLGKRVFVGSNATLVAPVEVGDEGYVGAGSVITDNVEPGALALGRARQVTKPGWVEKRKSETEGA